MSQEKQRERLYGKLIVDLVNAPTVEEAVPRFIENIQRAFDFSPQFVESEGPKMLALARGGLANWYNVDTEELRDFMAEFIKEKNVYKTKNFGHFRILYEYVGRPDIVVEQDGSITEMPRFDENLFEDMHYTLAIAYCLVRFLMSPENRKLVHKCEWCEKYFIAKTKKKQRFCRDTCRSAYHNRKGIESGEAAAYKRRKRREGAKESYYG